MPLTGRCDCSTCTLVRKLAENGVGRYVSKTYHHGVAEQEARSSICECGYWSCIFRGCGDCPDCHGEHCECEDGGMPSLLCKGDPQEDRSYDPDVHYWPYVEAVHYEITAIKPDEDDDDIPF